MRPPRSDRISDFEHDRHDDGRAAEADGAQRRNLPRARTDRGVHRIERGEGRAERHDEGDDARERPDRLPELLGLPAVVLLLRLHVDVEARVRGQVILQCRECRPIVELQANGAVSLPVECRLRDLDVGPELALVRVPRLEHAHHRPVRAAHAQRLAEPGAFELACDATADDQLAQSRTETPALDDLQLRPQRERRRLDTADRDVRPRLLAGLQQFCDDDHFGRGDRTPVRALPDPGRLLDQRSLVAAEAGIELRLGSTAHHERDIGAAGGLQASTGSRLPWRASAVKTATTPAIPTTITSDWPSRCGMLRRPSGRHRQDLLQHGASILPSGRPARRRC